MCSKNDSVCRGVLRGVDCGWAAFLRTSWSQCRHWRRSRQLRQDSQGEWNYHNRQEHLDDRLYISLECLDYILYCDWSMHLDCEWRVVFRLRLWWSCLIVTATPTGNKCGGERIHRYPRHVERVAVRAASGVRVQERIAPSKFPSSSPFDSMPKVIVESFECHSRRDHEQFATNDLSLGQAWYHGWLTLLVSDFACVWNVFR